MGGRVGTLVVVRRGKHEEQFEVLCSCADDHKGPHPASHPPSSLLLGYDRLFKDVRGSNHATLRAKPPPQPHVAISLHCTYPAYRAA